MGLFNVPQFIDIEDKIVGPLTAKQLGWIGLAGVLLLLCWSFLDTSTFIVVAIVVSLVFGALAFYRPNGQPLIYFIFSAISFVFRPKMYIWKRIPDKSVTKYVPSKKTNSEKNAKINIASKKDTSSQKIEDLSHLLDGQNH
jgi:hypothetical protein